MTGIAIVGMACRYPDAANPAELWENVLAQRQSFRQLPERRLRADDYFSPNPAAPDRSYSLEAAVIDGYEFDRVGFRISGPTYRSTDLAHWLALDVASQALADARLPDRDCAETTGVIVGNTLTGELSRANNMRLRWPFVRRVVAGVLADGGWDGDRLAATLGELERRFKDPFPAIGDESLAGSLSNTIAGRICNHFDFKGGGYTVDGACASSLLAVTTAAAALESGDLDVALAGGVDISLDPFELIGFAKVGAFARDRMRVYDRRSAGFWPGEGCGFVVLVREEDAHALGLRTYAVIRGWGVSSDGSGGITRPEVEGQALAVRRAYSRAGYGIETVALFEGHGTGTAVGDATELRALTLARRETGVAAPPAAIGSVKANIGHTKAAAGIAAVIKATMALTSELLPPTTGCEEPHPELAVDPPALRILRRGEPWPADTPVRAGVSAFGFGGINTHVALEAAPAPTRVRLDERERLLVSSGQSVELIVLGAESAAGLRLEVERLATSAPSLSLAELSDLATELAGAPAASRVRASLVVSTRHELIAGLDLIRGWLEQGVTSALDIEHGVFLGTGSGVPRIGFLFPGQGAPAYLDGGALRARFPFVDDLYARADLPQGGDGVATAVAQPAIVLSSLGALAVLERLGVKADVAAGHSLGELTALHWAGALDQAALLRTARARGRAMQELGDGDGAMASLVADEAAVRALVNGNDVVIAGLNGPQQTVVAGARREVESLVARAQAAELTAQLLRVSHAFHSPLVAAAVPALRAHLDQEEIGVPAATVLSTVTGDALDATVDLRELLCRQVVEPVRFADAAALAADRADLLIEVGPGRILGGLARTIADTPAISVDAGSSSLRGLLQAVGAAYALGAPVRTTELAAGRFTRPVPRPEDRRFLENPCEALFAGEPDVPLPEMAPSLDEASADAVAVTVDGTSEDDVLELVRRIVAERAELPLETIDGETLLLGELHLNSIVVGQIAAEAARALGVPPPMPNSDFSDLTAGQLATALADMVATGATLEAAEAEPAGAGTWIRPFVVDLVDRDLVPPPLPWADPDAGWTVVATPAAPEPGDDPAELAVPGADLPGLLAAALRPVERRGVVVHLPAERDDAHVRLLIDGAKLALSDGAACFVVVHHGAAAGGFVRSLQVEEPRLTTCLIEVPDDPRAVEWVVAEAAAAVGHVEVVYDAEGRRRVPVWRLHAGGAPITPLPLGPEDVILVTGGGKGIAAESALVLAGETGARLGLIGRSRPEDDGDLAANLERIGLVAEAHYVAADVTDASAVRAAVDEVEATLGPITAVIHGAGQNRPQLISSLDEQTVLETVAPKVTGARNVLECLDRSRLRLFVAFGSIIARTGLRGEAHYALANERLTRVVEQLAEETPTCRCVSLEWSVWSGVGMGARLGVVDALVAQGVTPITPDEGMRWLQRLVADPATPSSVIVAGRFGRPPTVELDERELPLLRFLERPRVSYPGIELVADAELSGETDPYLADHVYQGVQLFPAVLGLEAMAQAVCALTGSAEVPVFDDVHFERPITVATGGTTSIRIAALMRDDGGVDVTIRSAETGFAANHFSAVCRHATGDARLGQVLDGTDGELKSLADDLYGRLLFHGGRFRRLAGYHRLTPSELLAQIAPDGDATWFGAYLPQTLLLGDPGARDASLHAAQAGFPRSRLLPVRIGRLAAARLGFDQRLYSRVQERGGDGELLRYEIEVGGPDGTVVEHWEDVGLRIVDHVLPDQASLHELIGPYVERRVRALAPGADLSFVLVAEAEATSDDALRLALDADVQIARRPDGKPEARNGRAVSVAHGGGLLAAVAGEGSVACDVEPVEERERALWQDLLGMAGAAVADAVVSDAGGDFTTAATRVWAAAECLKKAGAPVTAPLALATSDVEGWVVLTSGRLLVPTFSCRVQDVPDPVVIAVLVEKGQS